MCQHPTNLQLASRTFLTHCAPQKDEFLRLAINAIHNDLISRNEAFQSLALTFVSNSECHATAGFQGDFSCGCGTDLIVSEQYEKQAACTILCKICLPPPVKN